MTSAALVKPNLGRMSCQFPPTGGSTEPRYVFSYSCNKKLTKTITEHFWGRFVEQMLMLSSCFRCYQIHNYQRYDFGHTLLCHISRTWYSTNPPLKLDKFLAAKCAAPFGGYHRFLFLGGKIVVTFFPRQAEAADRIQPSTKISLVRGMCDDVGDDCDACDAMRRSTAEPSDGVLVTMLLSGWNFSGSFEWHV